MLCDLSCDVHVMCHVTCGSLLTCCGSVVVAVVVGADPVVVLVGVVHLLLVNPIQVAPK